MKTLFAVLMAGLSLCAYGQQVGIAIVVPTGNSIQVTSPTTTVPTGTTISLTAQAFDNSTPPIGNIFVTSACGWASLNNAVATVNAAGVVTGVSPGTAVITCTYPPNSATPLPVGTITITVPQAPNISNPTCTSPPCVIPGSTGIFSFIPSASGGVLPYTWSISSGSLPGWATLNSATGAITGTATVGSTSFTLTVNDSALPVHGTSSIALTLTISGSTCGPPTYTCFNTTLSTIPISSVPSMGGLTGAGTCVTDPDFGAKICRLTDGNFKSNGPAYGTLTASGSGSAEEMLMNSNDTMILTFDNGGRVFPMTFSGTNAARMYATNPTWSAYGGIFFNDSAFFGHSNSNPGYMYNLGNGMAGTAGAKGSIFGYWDFSNQSTPPSFQQLFDYKSSANCLGSGFGTVTWGTIGGSDATDTDFAFAFSNNGGQGGAGAVYIAVWRSGSGCRLLNLSTGAITGDWGTSGAMTGTTCLLNTGTGLHNVKIAKLAGTLQWDYTGSLAQCSDSGSGNAYVWYYGAAGTSGLKVAPLVAASGGGGGGHHAMGLTHYVNETGNNAPNYASIRTIASAPSAPTGITNGFISSAAYPLDTDSHIGWNTLNDAYPLCGSSATVRGEPITTVFQNEIFLFDPTGVSNPWRAAHTFNSATQVQSFSTEYAISVCSADGKYVVFGSDWESTLGSTSGGSSCVIGGTTWKASTGFGGPTNVDYIVPKKLNNAGGYSYFASTPGTSGTTTPTTFNQIVGGTTTDGTVTWTNAGVPNCRGDVFVAWLFK